MDVSAVIPTHNRASLVVTAIESVLAQSRPPAELIVVDDGSTDETGRVLATFEPRIRVIRQENRGVSAARNAGIAAARAPWIALLDSDDYWTADKLAAQIDHVARHPGTLILQSQDRWIRNDRAANPKGYHAKRGGWIYRDCLPRCIVSSSDVLIRRELLEREGGFDETLPACEDYDLYLRIASIAPIGLCEHVGTVKRGGHADQLSRRFWGMDRFRVRALIKMLGRPLSDPDRAATVATLDQKLRILTMGARKRGNVAGAAEWEELRRAHCHQAGGPQSTACAPTSCVESASRRSPTSPPSACGGRDGGKGHCRVDTESAADSGGDDERQ
ncbi:MAG: glycosyltransferase family 2 protein [Candidatus Schekmanbacteria bacterium]|nr:glycosyltransferase family 2 protein [Candidatus Schekmanbacteria bacterium]